MDLNRETAMRLWNKSFGKETKVKDFAGRTIAKGAYNDRNSECGWNVDHILPQSRGGTTADHNLICCHILTNDEKADKFPCFNANDISFEIIKVQNHYEIRQKSNGPEKQKDVSEAVDFYDSAAGVRFFKKLKGVQNKKRFVGNVFVVLYNVTNTAVVDFIEELFGDENISYSVKKNCSLCTLGSSAREQSIQVRISDYDMPLKENICALLDKCVLLNTYLSSYFLECEYINGFNIIYRIDCIDDKSKMYSSNYEPDNNLYSQLKNSMFVNELVLINTGTGEKVQIEQSSGYAEYDSLCTNLSKNLKKEANGK
ncbi:MAG: HNH endonuclease [Agathobacter sp.]|nr:HNH endonuclease [Agathobacter sp.]